MKKKEKDDIMGEEQSDLPVNEGTSTVTSPYTNTDMLTLE